MRPGTWKAVLVFSALFVAGGAVGSLVTLRFARHQPPAPPREGLSPQLVRRFTERLDLQPDQAARIEPILAVHTEELRKIRRESFERTDAISQRMLAAVETHLTPEQRTKLEELRKEQRARFEKWINDRERDRQRRDDGASRAPGEPRGPEGPPGPSSEHDGPPPPPAP